MEGSRVVVDDSRSAVMQRLYGVEQGGLAEWADDSTMIRDSGIRVPRPCS